MTRQAVLKASPHSILSVMLVSTCVRVKTPFPGARDSSEYVADAERTVQLGRTQSVDRGWFDGVMRYVGEAIVVIASARPKRAPIPVMRPIVSDPGGVGVESRKTPKKIPKGLSPRTDIYVWKNKAAQTGAGGKPGDHAC